MKLRKPISKSREELYECYANESYNTLQLYADYGQFNGYTGGAGETIAEGFGIVLDWIGEKIEKAIKY